ncbi:MAG: alanyl-tRNA editing protein [Candidatus Heimdallarchaeota archaeon]|nr:alanyl-tRNA editing protein [Candidatus Heimdallarchaeota archaeon]MCK5143109.1 alanyl-tRNA editing protein [Candidatus Heimdallarchaeota archaeon]
MTELLFQQDSYLKEFEAKIIEIIEDSVILDRTAFAPKGGGLTSDLGTLSFNDGKQLDVIEVTSKGGKIYHKLSSNPENKYSGTLVKGILDWERRYKQMRLHTVLHSISSILYKKYGTTVTGGNITPEKSRVDFDIDHLRQERIQEIETKVKKIIDSDHKVSVSFLEREEALKDPDLIRTKVNLIPENVKILRIVDIENIDRQADGGVHVKSTKEIGSFVPLKTENRGKDKKRLYFTVKP